MVEDRRSTKRSPRHPTSSKSPQTGLNSLNVRITSSMLLPGSTSMTSTLIVGAPAPTSGSKRLTSSRRERSASAKAGMSTIRTSCSARLATTGGAGAGAASGVMTIGGGIERSNAPPEDTAPQNANQIVISPTPNTPRTVSTARTRCSPVTGDPDWAGGARPDKPSGFPPRRPKPTALRGRIRALDCAMETSADSKQPLDSGSDLPGLLVGIRMRSLRVPGCGAEASRRLAQTAPPERWGRGHHEPMMIRNIRNIDSKRKISVAAVERRSRPRLERLGLRASEPVPWAIEHRLQGSPRRLGPSDRRGSPRLAVTSPELTIAAGARRQSRHDVRHGRPPSQAAPSRRRSARVCS